MICIGIIVSLLVYSGRLIKKYGYTGFAALCLLCFVIVFLTYEAEMNFLGRIVTNEL